jgi:hypothetical protein
MKDDPLDSLEPALRAYIEALLVAAEAKGYLRGLADKRRGGPTAEDRRNGGVARAAKLTPKQRSTIARDAALARWDGEHKA